MKANIRTKINKILVFLLGLLGISCLPQCNAYGSPYATFMLDGKVTNELNEPLENIQVATRIGYRGNGKIYYDHKETTYTASDGRFEQNLGFSGEDIFKIVVTDTSNVYNSDSIIIEAHYNGEDGWYRGYDHVTVDFILPENEEKEN